MDKIKYLRWIFWIVLVFMKMDVLAAKVSVEQIGIALPKARVEHSWSGQKRVHGYDFDVKTYEVPLGIVDLTAYILKQLKTPPVLQAIPKGVLISDVKDRYHWLIRLTDLDTSHTSAVISILDWNQRTPKPISWMPKQANLLFESSTESLHAYDSTHVYQARLPLIEFQKRIYSQLLQEGWRHKSSSELALRQSWEKSGKVVHLFFHQEDGYTRVSIFSHKE